MSIQRRVVAWYFAVMPAPTVAIAVLALTPTPGAAQSLVVSPRVSVMGGDETAASAGLRAEVGSSRIAVFGQFGGFAVSQGGCDLSSACPSGGGIELLGGVRLSLPRLGPVRPAVSLGAGALLWDDHGPTNSRAGTIWEAELRAGGGAFSWADLLLGAVVKSVAQSVSGGMRIERDRGTFGGVVVGLVIPVSGG